MLDLQIHVKHKLVYVYKRYLNSLSIYKKLVFIIIGPKCTSLPLFSIIGNVLILLYVFVLLLLVKSLRGAKKKKFDALTVTSPQP